VRLVYTQISPGHIWTTLYYKIRKKYFNILHFVGQVGGGGGF
jgi:hypothetical protein